MDYTTKLLYQSNQWYNDGLEKAKIRDMSGAIVSLRKSLQYNRMNIAARNLLGLVYYGRGDINEALVEWILSKHFQEANNIADYYIDQVRKNKTEFEGISQAVKQYNQSLSYARQGNEDLAIIQLKRALSTHATYVKAYQLLALIYIHTKQYAAARKLLRTVHRLDTTDEFTLRYMHELNEIRKETPITNKKAVIDPAKKAKTVNYTIGNETIIQPAQSQFKQKFSRKTLMNAGVGFLIGVVIMTFLVLPAVNTYKQKKVNESMVGFSDQIAEQEAQIAALKTELETYRSDSEDSQAAAATAADAADSYENLMEAAIHYNAKDRSDAAIIELLLEVNPDALGESGKERYEKMCNDLYPDQCEELYEKAQASFEVRNYDYVVTFLEQIIAMDEGYSNGNALLLLAQTYEAQEEQDKANLMYQKLVEEYSDTTAGTQAKEALDAQNEAQEEEDAEEDDE